MKYQYAVTIPSAGTTSVVHVGEFEAADMLDAGNELLDKFEDLKEAKSVLIKLIE